MAFKIRAFEELSNRELYEIIKLRFDVFVDEQTSIYEEHDRIDYDALHMFTPYEGGHMEAYLRLFKIDENLASIGRVAVHPDSRGRQLGRQFMIEAIAYIDRHWQCDIKIGAQVYLKTFYESLDFVTSSEPYDDGGIPHVSMIRKFRGCN